MVDGGARRTRYRRGARPLRAAGAGLLVWALVLALVPGAAPAAAGSEDRPARVLLVGDWTWRYRLWQHLSATASTPVDLVGPRDDRWDLCADGPGNQEYADPGFDRDHAALWGQTMWQASQGVGETVARPAPDVVVAALGTNDLLGRVDRKPCGPGWRPSSRRYAARLRTPTWS